MRVSVFASLAATLASVVSAQSDPSQYAAGLLQALQGANLTTLASLATTNAATLLPLLQGGNRTIFAPSDAAFAALPESVTSDSALVANTLLYHIYYGSYAPSNLSEAHTIGRSALNSSDYVNLPSNAGQVAVFVSGEGGNMTMGSNSTMGGNSTMSGQSATVIQATSNVTSTAYTKFQNLDIYIIDEVLDIPMNLTATASAAGLTSLTGALTQYAPQAVTALSEQEGLTLFAPVNSAFESAMSLIGTLNDTTIANVLLNHVIAGVVVYSPLISNGLNATSAGGATMSFMTNDTGVFVMSGNATAQVIRADIPIENGVVHLIDRVLANTESNPAAASSAAASASSVAATNSQAATGAPAPTASGNTGAGNGGSGGTSSATKLAAGGFAGVVALGVAALF